MEKKDLEEVFRRNGLLSEYREQSAVSVWPSVVDETIAYLTSATHVEKKTLYVIAESSAIAQELQLQEEDLVHRVNTAASRPAIRRIRFAVGEVLRQRTKPRVRKDPEAEQASEILFESMDDSPLRDAFFRLAVAQKHREASKLASGARVCPQCGISFSGEARLCPGCRYEGVIPQEIEPTEPQH